MQVVGIIGAGGFIGRRMVQVFSEQALQVRPIVRTESSAAQFSGLRAKPAIADATDALALQAAVAGCDVVVHCAAGSPWFIRDTAKKAYQTANQAGVKRLVYLSTASVHGQAPAPGTVDDSPLSDRQFLAYNNAKVQAERILLQLRSSGTTEVVMIRPGIVTGSGSSWVTGFVNSLLAGTAYLGNGGKGICNSVDIDNLVEQIRLAVKAPNADKQAFLAGDREVVTWADLYQPLAVALGFDLAKLPNIDCTHYQISSKERLREGLRNTQLLGKLVASVAKLKKPKGAASPQQPPLNYEMATLYNCQYKLPYSKSQTMLGYEPIVSFSESCDRTVEWLAQKGYPIKK